MSNSSETAERHPQANLPGLSLAALGIVFGDIGTSPLYTFKTILNMAGKAPDAGVVLGFAMMERNAVHVSDFFSPPSDQVVEIGRQITI